MEYEKKGFTLIELIAVIVILSIIILIASPITISIINKVQKSAFKDSAYGIIKAGEMYYTSKMMEPDGMTQIKTFNFSEGTEELKIKGSKPTSGTMVVTKEGNVGLAISNGKYCVKKGTTNEDVTIDENIEECTIPSIMTATNTCIKLGNVCSIEEIKRDDGILVNVKVNNNENYNFYVISDTGEDLTLIMEKNLGNKVGWSPVSPANGPLISLNYLEEQTLSWTNIPKNTYRLIDDNNPPEYELVLIENVRARMLTKTEVEGLVSSNFMYNAGSTGIRPVIILPKTI